MYLVTGANGQLGNELKKRLTGAVFADKSVLDITNANAVQKFVKENNIDLIINCAAYTAVDKAEEDVLQAIKVNIDGPRNLAQTGAKIIHISTDQDILRKLEKEKILVFTPSRRVQGRRVVCYDDRFIVKLALDSDGIIVSNDNYRDLQVEKPEWKKFIEERLLMYSFVNDKYVSFL